MATWETISRSDRIGRLGVAYVRSVLAQAAIPNEETSSGEDHLAVDLSVQFPSSAVRVQVKSGTRAPNKNGSITVPLEARWCRVWAASQIPVYLVYVRLEKSRPRDWLAHLDLHTTMHAHAHWVRVNGVSAASVRVPLANRLSINTFDAWHQDVEACFSPHEGLSR